MSHMYFDTFIAVAPDYVGTTSKVPVARGAKPTIAQLQYEMLIDAPFVHTQEDVLFEVWLARQDFAELAGDEIDALRAEYFATGRACMRASPLTKTHGWGVAFDAEGRAALLAMETTDYTRWSQDPAITVVPAMRSKRA